MILGPLFDSYSLGGSWGKCPPKYPHLFVFERICRGLLMGFPIFPLTVLTMLVPISLLVRLFLLCIEGIIECRWEACFFPTHLSNIAALGTFESVTGFGSTELVHMKSSQRPQCHRSVILIHDLLEMIRDFPSGKSTGNMWENVSLVPQMQVIKLFLW